MNKYQIMMNVEDMLLQIEGKPSLMGYFQTFKIEAVSPEQAQLRAVEMICNDEEMKSVWLQQNQTKPPKISVEEICLVDDFDEDITGNCTGRAFYPAKQWWQFWK